MFSIAVKHQNVCQNVEAKVIVQREIFVEKATAQTLVRQRRNVHRRKGGKQFVEMSYAITLQLDVINPRIVLKVESGLLLG